MAAMCASIAEAHRDRYLLATANELEAANVGRSMSDLFWRRVILLSSHNPG